MKKAKDNKEIKAEKSKRSAISRISPKAWVISLILHITIAACFININFQNAGAGQSDHETEAMIFDSAQLSDGLDSQQQLDQLQTEMQSAQLTPDFTPQTAAQLDNAAEIENDIPTEQIPDLIGDQLSQQITKTETTEKSTNTEQQNKTESTASITDQSWQKYVTQNTSISNTAGTGKGAASFFGIQSKGSKFIYIVDCSGSMKGDPLKAAKTEVRRSLKSLKRNMEFTIIFYSTDSKTIGKTRLAKATRSNIQKYNNWIEDISASGGTNPTNALKLALSLKPDCIWLLSDGQFDDGTLALIKQLNPKAKTKINTIAFLDDSGSELLKQIAKQNRGRFRFVNRPRSIKR